MFKKDPDIYNGITLALYCTKKLDNVTKIPGDSRQSEIEETQINSYGDEYNEANYIASVQLDTSTELQQIIPFY